MVSSGGFLKKPQLTKIHLYILCSFMPHMLMYPFIITTLMCMHAMRCRLR
jgi:hypothetical protein